MALHAWKKTNRSTGHQGTVLGQLWGSPIFLLERKLAATRSAARGKNWISNFKQGMMNDEVREEKEKNLPANDANWREWKKNETTAASNFFVVGIVPMPFLLLICKERHGDRACYSSRPTARRSFRFTRWRCVKFYSLTLRVKILFFHSCNSCYPWLLLFQISNQQSEIHPPNALCSWRGSTLLAVRASFVYKQCPTERMN
jgi:hypothetical protein